MIDRNNGTQLGKAPKDRRFSLSKRLIGILLENAANESNTIAGQQITQMADCGRIYLGKQKRSIASAERARKPAAYARNARCIYS